MNDTCIPWNVQVIYAVRVLPILAFIRQLKTWVVKFKRAYDFKDPGCTAFDLKDGVLTASIIKSGLPVNTFVTGNHTIPYTCCDLRTSPHCATVSRVVEVVQTISPVITLLGNATVSVYKHHAIISLYLGLIQSDFIYLFFIFNNLFT